MLKNRFSCDVAWGAPRGRRGRTKLVLSASNIVSCQRSDRLRACALSHRRPGSTESGGGACVCVTRLLAPTSSPDRPVVSSLPPLSVWCLFPNHPAAPPSRRGGSFQRPEQPPTLSRGGNRGPAPPAGPADGQTPRQSSSTLGLGIWGCVGFGQPPPTTTTTATALPVSCPAAPVPTPRRPAVVGAAPLGGLGCLSFRNGWASAGPAPLLPRTSRRTTPLWGAWKNPRESAPATTLHGIFSVLTTSHSPVDACRKKQQGQRQTSKEG